MGCCLCASGCSRWLGWFAGVKAVRGSCFGRGVTEMDLQLTFLDFCSLRQGGSHHCQQPHQARLWQEPRLVPAGQAPAILLERVLNPDLFKMSTLNRRMGSLMTWGRGQGRLHSRKAAIRQLRLDRGRSSVCPFFWLEPPSLEQSRWSHRVRRHDS